MNDASIAGFLDYSCHCGFVIKLCLSPFFRTHVTIHTTALAQAAPPSNLFGPAQMTKLVNLCFIFYVTVRIFPVICVVTICSVLFFTGPLFSHKVENTARSITTNEPNQGLSGLVLTITCVLINTRRVIHSKTVSEICHEENDGRPGAGINNPYRGLHDGKRKKNGR